MEKETKKSIDIKELQEAFKIFSEASSSLTASYEALKTEVERLKDELKEKNRQIKEYGELVDTILMNSSSGILTVSNTYEILLKNKIADNTIKNFGKDFLNNLYSFTESGIYEFNIKENYFKLSVSKFNMNNIFGLIYIFDDITTLKIMEIEKSRNEKLTLMGEMAANIAHQIRNPLGSIELFTSILQRDISADTEKTKLTGAILKGVKTINNTISNILLFTKDVKVNKQKCYISDIIDDVVLYLMHLMKDKNIIFQNKINEEDTAYCDVELIKQCIMNLIHNAIDAVDENGKIVVTSFCNEKHSVIEITDNGKGIPEEFLNRLFIPFQTTKAKGTGLGLSIVYKIIKAHGGNIIPESKQREYTSFKIILPNK